MRVNKWMDVMVHMTKHMLSKQMMNLLTSGYLLFNAVRETADNGSSHAIMLMTPHRMRLC